MKENIINWSTTLTLRCADGCGAGSGDGGGGSVFDSVPYSLKLKNSPISDSFHMDVLWCGTSFSLHGASLSALCISVPCYSFSSWSYDGSESRREKGTGANSNCSLIGVSPRRRLGVCLLLLLFSCMISTRRRLTFWPVLRGSKWLSKQSCHVPS